MPRKRERKGGRERQYRAKEGGMWQIYQGMVRREGGGGEVSAQWFRQW